MPVSRVLFEVGAAFVLGATILILPVALDPSHQRYPAAFLPLIRDAVEGLRPYSLLLLILLGVLMGVFFRSSVLLLAAAAVGVSPCGPRSM
jgi:hypothetical protein